MLERVRAEIDQAGADGRELGSLHRTVRRAWLVRRLRLPTKLGHAAFKLAMRTFVKQRPKPVIGCLARGSGRLRRHPVAVVGLPWANPDLMAVEVEIFAFMGKHDPFKFVPPEFAPA